MYDSDRFKEGGLPVIPENVLRLISELEGSYQLCKYMGFKEDRDVIRSICDPYYKLYFKLKREQNDSSSH